MELIIKGDDKKLNRLAKELKIRLKRDGLEASINNIKNIEVKAETVKEPKKQASKKSKKQ